MFSGSGSEPRASDRPPGLRPDPDLSWRRREGRLMEQGGGRAGGGEHAAAAAGRKWEDAHAEEHSGGLLMRMVKMLTWLAITQ